MTRRPADHYGIASTTGEGVTQTRPGVEALAPLIQGQHLHIGTEANLTIVQRHGARHQVDQCRLTRTVWANEPDSVAPL